MRVLRILAMLAPLAAAFSYARQPTASLLDPMRDRDRPILLFAGDHDPRVVQQYRELIAHPADIADRQIALVLVTRTPVPPAPAPPTGTVAATSQQQAALRTTFHIAPGAFAVILLGKDGGEKFRSTSVVPFQTFAALIDGMPMRQQELRSR